MKTTSIVLLTSCGFLLGCQAVTTENLTGRWDVANINLGEEEIDRLFGFAVLSTGLHESTLELTDSTFSMVTKEGQVFTEGRYSVIGENMTMEHKNGTTNSYILSIDGEDSFTITSSAVSITYQRQE